MIYKRNNHPHCGPSTGLHIYRLRLAAFTLTNYKLPTEKLRCYTVRKELLRAGVSRLCAVNRDTHVRLSQDEQSEYADERDPGRVGEHGCQRGSPCGGIDLHPVEPEREANAPTDTSHNHRAGGEPDHKSRPRLAGILDQDAAKRQDSQHGALY